jgi:hypothetical protein
MQCKSLATALTLGLVALLTACSGVQVTDYGTMQPQFNPKEFFNGNLTAHGVVQNRAGKVTRSFTADITAYWKDGIGTLEEDFVFDDGEEQRRVWTLTPNGENQYIGTAGDVVGEGVMVHAGNSVFLDYVLRIAYGDGDIDVRVDDRMYLVSNTVLINESKLSKFGVRVGDLLLVITRNPVSSN